MLRFSVVDFLNARPLTWGLLREPPPGVEVSRDLPSVCADKLASGQADVGLIPSIEYQRIPGLRVVPGLGIAASSEVRSVLLVSKVSRERITSVALDPASRTSAALTRILLARRYGIAPEFVEGAGEGTDARLVIGDPALKARLNGHVVLDLAAEWRAFTGRSFVFAFWAVRDGVDAEAAARIVLESRERGRQEFSRLVREEAGETGLSEAVIEDYLRHSLHFDLDRADFGGLELFYRLAVEGGVIESARPIDFLEAVAPSAGG
ncbi:MAG: menaquinone biosynthesis protein [Acidobacteria bacterium]|nr:menaquinone biosynthesis protein [Acidobacteriota bacterium]MCA1611999.1 menaquinone biosynthesis protein [Acidobacteriota bacterium]